LVGLRKERTEQLLLGGIKKWFLEIGILLKRVPGIPDLGQIRLEKPQETTSIQKRKRREDLRGTRPSGGRREYGVIQKKRKEVKGERPVSHTTSREGSPLVY